MVEIIPANNHIDEFLCLVKEYTDTILAEVEEVARTLAVQHLDDELGHVAAKYGQPGECMYIARVDGVPAGSWATAICASTPSPSWRAPSASTKRTGSGASANTTTTPRHRPSSWN